MNPDIDHDQLFKQLLQTFFVDFIHLFAPALTTYLDLSQVTFLPQQYFTDIIDGDRKAIDILAQAPLQDQQSEQQTILIHIENQADSRTKFNQRMFFYFAELHREYRIPIYPIAVLSFEEPKRFEPSHYHIYLPNLEVLTFNFQTIQLNRLNWRDFLATHNPVAAAFMAKMKIAKKDRPKVKVECLRLLANLQLDPARSFLISGFVDTYLRLNLSEERIFQKEIAKIETVTEQEKVMELTTSWMEQGIEQERRSAICSLLKMRYGSIDDQLTNILPFLMTLTSVDYTPLIFQLSKEELIQHCNTPAS
jgi:hypothetical protein